MGKLSSPRATDWSTSAITSNRIVNSMKINRLLLRTVPLLTLILLGSPSSRASDHADPLVLNPLRPPKVREPRITDLHVFLDKDQDPSLPEPTALVLDFCVFPAMAPLT